MNWWLKSTKRFVQLEIILNTFIFLHIFVFIFLSSLIGLKIGAIAARIKQYKSITVLLSKSKLNNTEVLIFKALINSNISHDEFLLINNMLKEYDEMKEEIKNPPFDLARDSLSKILVCL